MAACGSQCAVALGAVASVQSGVDILGSLYEETTFSQPTRYTL